MSYFWLLAIVFTGIALVLLVRPFIRHRKKIESLFENTGDLAIYRDHLKELERDRATGVVSEEEAEAVRTEIGHRMIQAEEATTKAEFYFDPLRTAGMIVLTLTIGAVIVYAFQGSPLLQSRPFDTASATADPTGEVAKFVEKQEKKLRDNPDELEDWIRLAEAYRFLGRYREASEASAHAVGLAGTDRPDLLAVYAENLVLAENGEVTKEARRAFCFRPRLRPEGPLRPLLSRARRCPGRKLRSGVEALARTCQRPAGGPLAARSASNPDRAAQGTAQKQRRAGLAGAPSDVVPVVGPGLVKFVRAREACDRHRMGGEPLILVPHMQQQAGWLHDVLRHRVRMEVEVELMARTR